MPMFDRNAMNGGDAAVRVTFGDGRTGYARAVVAVDPEGEALDPGGKVYQLASGSTIPGTSGTAPTTGARGGSYIWDTQFTGTSVVLQSLASDGTTWRDVATRTTSGAIGVVIGQKATVRLYNPNVAAVTAVSSSLS